jgi:hypothetical protein
MSETNLFFHAITEALNAHIERAVEARLTALQQAYANAIGELAKRVEALENNPAIGVDTTLEARVKVLEEKPAVAVDIKQAIEELNNTEWFWEKVHNTINDNVASRVEEAIDDHLSSYDHDQYDEMYNEWGGESVSDFVKDDDIESQINDALRNASFDVRVTL